MVERTPEPALNGRPVADVRGSPATIDEDPPADWELAIGDADADNDNDDRAAAGPAAAAPAGASPVGTTRNGDDAFGSGDPDRADFRRAAGEGVAGHD